MYFSGTLIVDSVSKIYMILDSLRSLVSESMTELITVRRTVQMLLCKPASFLILAFLMPSPASSQRSSRAPFHPPEGILVAGLRETATHRGSMPSLRITSDRGMPSNANFWIDLDASGHVLEVRDIQTEDFYHPHFNSNDLIEAVHKVVYVPFTRNGNPQALFQDTGNSDEKPDDQTYLMRAVESGVWSMIDDATFPPTRHPCGRSR